MKPGQTGGPFGRVWIETMISQPTEPVGGIVSVNGGYLNMNYNDVWFPKAYLMLFIIFGRFV